MLMETATHFSLESEPAMAKAPRDDDFAPELPRRRRYVHEDDEPERTDEDRTTCRRLCSSSRFRRACRHR